jgi:thioredoxin-dependent peroxiredoxin
MLALGTPAPDAQVITHLGFEGPLRHFWERGPLILFFYPKDETSICTRQACTLQTSLSEFSRCGATVLGASTGSLESKRGFAAKHRLDFPLVADVRGQLARDYEAFRTLIRIPKRITYVIGQDGRIVGRCHNELSVPAHLEMIQQVLGR